MKSFQATLMRCAGLALAIVPLATGNVVTPEQANLGLVRRARGGHRQVRPQVLDLIERLGELIRVHVRDSRYRNGVSAGDAEGGHAAPGRCQESLVGIEWVSDAVAGKFLRRLTAPPS